MACGGSSRTINGCVWTTGTTTEVFMVLTEAIEVSTTESFRVELEFRNRSGDIQIKRGLQYSDDAVTWDSATAFDAGGGWISSEGFSLPSDYTNTDKTRRWIRFGVIAQSSAAADNEEGRVTYMLDLKSR